MLHNYLKKKTAITLLGLVFLLLTSNSSLFAQITVQLGTGTSTSSASGGAGTAAVYNRFWESRKTQVIYTAAEINAAGVSVASNINALALYVTTDINGTLPNFTIKMKNSSTSSFSAFETTGFTTVYTSTPSGTGATLNNWKTFTFTTPFAWDGTSNIVVEFCHEVLTGFNSTGVIRQYAGATNSLRSVTSGSANQCPTTTGGTNGANKPQVQLTFVAPACSGTPVLGGGGATTVTPTSACLGGTVALSVTPPFASNLTFQWQSGPSASGPFNNISGAVSSSVSVGTPSTATFYQCVVTCTNSGLSATSTPNSFTPVGVPTYATLPFTETFEADWTTSPCVTSPSTLDRPNQYWVNSPAQGNNSWRRDDGQNTAAWSFTTSGAYTPTGANSTTHSARFHTYGANSGLQGSLDLYIDLSSSTNDKQLSFSYRNPTGTDKLEVFLSTDGGNTFSAVTTSPASLTTNSSWQTVSATISSNSATAVIRFRATSDYGNDDIGLDEISVIIPPDIEVRGVDNSVIADGTTATSTVNGTDFGTISVASTPFLDQTFTIGNTGTVDLTISSVTSSNTNFVIQTAPASTVGGASNTTFVVRFAPSTFGTFNSTITINNNDGDENPYTFAVTGTATAPTIAVSGLGVNIPNGKYLSTSTDGTFMGVATSGNPSAVFTISNGGNEALGVTGVSFSEGSAFSASGVPTSVASAGTADFTIDFNPANGSKLDTLTITSNAANAPSYRFVVSAGGVVSALDNNLEEGDLQVVPNPSTGSFKLQIKGAKYTSADFVVYDMAGRVVKSQKIAQFTGSSMIDLTKVEKGTYILVLETGGERVARKLIKQ
ncbi:MAG: choice-of-anchor D domain-containing protein [Thermonemataceae bacterium]|nr:choice-of-anchor D domain-containing protein [Thermonemataceae bacterium]